MNQPLDTLEQKSAELAGSLARKSGWLRSSMASIGEGVITIDTGGVVTTLNEVAQRLTGYPEHEGVGLPVTTVFRIVNETSRLEIENPAMRALQEGEVIQTGQPSVLISRDGIGRALEESAAPIRDEDGTIQGAVLVFRDVSVRRLTEAALVRLVSVIDYSDDAIITKSLDGIIATWNRAAERIFGWTEEEVIGRPITLLLPPERVHEEEEILRRLRRGERLDHFETARLHKDGHLVDVSVTSSPIRNAEGRIIGASKIARDITHRRRSERTSRFLADSSAALAELGDFESTLQRVASLAVPAFADLCAIDLVAADGSNRRLAMRYSDGVNEEAARDIIEYDSRRHGNHNLDTIVRSAQPIWIERVTGDDLEQLSRSPEHLAIIRRLQISSYMSVPMLSRGRVIGVLSFVTGRSGRSYDAAELAAAEDLADRAVIAFENASLVGVLQESDQRKDEFIAVLAHELRNPLAPIRNSIQVLRTKGIHVPEVRWAADVIDRQVNQMTRLVDDLLDVSRINSGKIQLRREPLAVAAIVQSAIDASRPLIEAARHDFSLAIPSDPIFVQGDLTRLSQVLLNLLNNAAKYTNPGGRISLSVERVADQVEIRVRDSGIGISPEMLPRIFEMFTQADRSLERSQGGLGIGLMLVRQLTEMHGGSVRALSQGAGLGSEFVVSLPMVAAPPPTRERRWSGGSSPNITRRILVVDDNRDSADSLAMLLGMLGNEIRSARDGLEAVRLAEEFKPEVVLLDIGLPKMNGYDAATRIRELLGQQVLLIALTGWGQESDRKRSREAGFDHHLTKPVDVDALKRLLAAGPVNS